MSGLIPVPNSGSFNKKKRKYRHPNEVHQKHLKTKYVILKAESFEKDY